MRTFRFGTLAAGLVCWLGASAAGEPAAGGAPKILLCPGLTVVTAISQSDGDYESIKTVESIDAGSVRIRYSSERMEFDWLSGDPPALKRTLTFRNVLLRDLEEASLYLQYFTPALPETVPDTTAIGLSRAFFQRIKTEGSGEFGIFVPFWQEEIGIDREKHPNVYDHQMIATVTRAGEEPWLTVTVDNREVALPTIRFEGDFFGDRSEFYVLDDPDNPLMLKFRIGIDAIAPLSPEEIEQRDLIGLPADIGPDKETLQVVKIVAPCATEAPAPEQTADIGGSGDAASSLPEAAGTGVAAGDLGPAMADGPGSGQPPGDDGPFQPNGLPAAAAAMAALERAVEEDGRAEIQSIFFTFNSAEIRPESDRTLQAIAGLLSRHPDWSFTIEGHTDAVGDDDYNLDLSRRRAEAVKTALVAQFAVAEHRLATAGYGEARPIADNATLEGRARNRRVELVRLP